MAKTLSNFDFDKARSNGGAGRSPIYDWDTILDGKTRLLVQGEDFNLGRGEDKPSNERAKSFINTVRSETANRHPKSKVRAAIVNEDNEPDAQNGVNVVVQVVPMTAEEINARQKANEQRKVTRAKNEKAKGQAKSSTTS